jgi:SAM-dependent methyltransferase
MEWWQDFFDETYLRLWSVAPALTPERTAETIAGVQRMLNLPPGASILDVACGHGRIAVPLAQAGYRVTGVDYSETMLALARRAATDAGVALDLVRGDMRALVFDRAFDVAISIFTAFGYFTDEAENQGTLESIARALKPGGKFLMDVSHRDRVVKIYRERDWGEVGGTVMWVRREVDAVRGIWTEHVYWLEEGAVKHRHFSVRNYVPSELDRMLRSAGLVPLQWFGDFDLSPFTLDSRRLIVLAERREMLSPLM